jgi:CheY-like chemotaxis protein
MGGKRVLSVGQCWADHGSIAHIFEKHFSADVQPAHSAADALTKLRNGGFDLVLVNRVLDGDGSSGVEFVRQLQADERLRHLPVMLVSNYDDAQKEASAAGAVPGFGKASLGQSHMLSRLKKYLD